MTGADVRARDGAVVAPAGAEGAAEETAFDTPRGLRYVGPEMFREDAYCGKVWPPGLCCLAIALASTMMWGAVIAGGWLVWPG